MVERLWTSKEISDVAYLEESEVEQSFEEFSKEKDLWFKKEEGEVLLRDMFAPSFITRHLQKQK